MTGLAELSTPMENGEPCAKLSFLSHKYLNQRVDEPGFAKVSKRKKNHFKELATSLAQLPKHGGKCVAFFLTPLLKPPANAASKSS